MSDYLNISDFLLPVNLHEISNDEGYKDGQLSGKDRLRVQKRERVKRARLKNSYLKISTDEGGNYQ